MQEISDRLSRIEKYYDLDALLSAKTDQSQVANYYKKSTLAYKLIHAKFGGAIHMAISSGGGKLN